jgi:hypothetical protein
MAENDCSSRGILMVINAEGGGSICNAQGALSHEEHIATNLLSLRIAIPPGGLRQDLKVITGDVNARPEQYRHPDNIHLRIVAMENSPIQVWLIQTMNGVV